MLVEQGALLILLITESDSCYPSAQTLESAPITVPTNKSTTVTNKQYEELKVAATTRVLDMHPHAKFNLCAL